MARCIHNSSTPNRCEREALPSNIYCDICRTTIENERIRELEEKEKLKQKHWKEQDNVGGPDWIYWVITGVLIFGIIFIILTHK